MRNHTKRQIQELRRIQQREVKRNRMTPHESEGIDRLLADMEKLDKPINRKYRFIKDMY